MLVKIKEWLFWHTNKLSVLAGIAAGFIIENPSVVQQALFLTKLDRSTAAALASIIVTVVPILARQLDIKRKVTNGN